MAYMMFRCRWFCTGCLSTAHHVLRSGLLRFSGMIMICRRWLTQEEACDAVSADSHLTLGAPQSSRRH